MNSHYFPSLPIETLIMLQGPDQINDCAPVSFHWLQSRHQSSSLHIQSKHLLYVCSKGIDYKLVDTDSRSSAHTEYEHDCCHEMTCAVSVHAVQPVYLHTEKNYFLMEKSLLHVQVRIIWKK